MRARFGAEAGLIFDWREPANVDAYALIDLLAAMSNVIEAHTSTTIVRLMVASAIILAVHSLYSSSCD